jgi:hypothetical protein
MIEICRKSLNEAQQRFVPDKHEHARPRWEEGPASTILGQVNKRQGGHHRRTEAGEDDQTKKSERRPMLEE